MVSSLLQHGDDVTLLDRLTLPDPDLLDCACARRLHGDLHLHGLEHDHGVAGGDAVTRLRGDLEHDPRDVRLDLFNHRTLLVRPSACAPAPDGARHSRERGGGTEWWSARPRRPSARARPPASIRMPSPEGSSSRSTLPGEGRKPFAGSSAYTRHSIAVRRCAISSWRQGSRSPWATRSWATTRSSSVTSSVTGCSTWSRV